jgi:hypothetical protein
MKKIYVALTVAFLAASCGLWGQAAAPAKNYEYRNGQWFNGTTFVPGTWYVVKGLLTHKAPSRVDSVIDLQQRWVVPPMADAHSAGLAGNAGAATVLKQYYDEGIFYLQILGNTREDRAALEKLVNKPTAPDAVFANGAITSTLGYPFLQVEGPAQGERNPKRQAEKYAQIKEQRKMLGDGYWFIDSKDALNRNWEQLKAQNPGVLSIYLLDVAKSGGKEGKGLTEDAAKAVVKKAHKAGLRVYAHIETLEDLRLGLKLGVDGFANLPGASWDGTGDTKAFELTDADLKLLAKKKTAVVPALSRAQTVGGQAIQAYHARLLKRLFDSGVNVVIGSGDPSRTARAELNYWFQLGGLDYTQVLRTLCENSPRAIYPKRKIGRIDDGYEASFVVLSDNPLPNLLKLRAVAFKVKNGQLVK